jgi:hypothetical protein
MKALKGWVGLLAVLFFVAQAQAANLDFELVNNTGVDIYEIYVGPSDQEEWGDDILEENVLVDGDSLQIEFEPEEEAELWDLMIKDEQGNAIYWLELDLTQISTFTLTMDTSSSRD